MSSRFTDTLQYESPRDEDIESPVIVIHSGYASGSGGGGGTTPGGNGSGGSGSGGGTAPTGNGPGGSGTGGGSTPEPIVISDPGGGATDTPTPQPSPSDFLSNVDFKKLPAWALPAGLGVLALMIISR